MTVILDKVSLPSDVKSLQVDELKQLADEVRGLIIETVSHTGGHLAANLGVVELTLALLKVFDPPSDKILWDVSHQTYAYKILTGRRDRFGTLRQPGGLSGFLRRDESEYDAFGAGHSGTALSAALGMAVVRDRQAGREHIVAVVGDGSAGCGISVEALNNLSATTRRLILVLNDNEMSISHNVGSMARYFGRLLANPGYNRWKGSVESLATKLRMGWLRSGYYRFEEAIKSLFLRSVIFEEFGLRYIGPIDGHNLHALLDAMTVARASDKPIVLHVATTKGKGYAPAEAEPERWHGTSPFDVASGKPRVKKVGPTYSDVMGQTLERLAATDERIMAITAAMSSGTGLSGFAARFPNRFYDVGISEEHAVVFAAGLATGGLAPVFAVYSTFAQRVVDYVIHDVCLQNLHVVLCLDRAGVVGDDGPTHHGVFDIALLRPVPGLVLMQPGDEAELAHMLCTAVRLDRPVVIRYPRGVGPGVSVPETLCELDVGKAVEVRPGRDVRIWALGDMLGPGLRAAELLAESGVSAGVVNPRFIQPLDTERLAAEARAAKVFVTAENGVLAGGFGSAVEEWLVGNAFPGRILRFGWPDRFIAHGAPDALMAEHGLTAEAMRDAVLRALA